MPKRFITYSRTEPARTILWAVGFLTALVQFIAFMLDPSIGAFLNFGLVASLALWATVAATFNRIKQMSYASFWLFFMWLYSGLTRLLVTSQDPTQMLWAPMLIIAVVMAVVYLYLSFQRKVGTDE